MPRRRTLGAVPFTERAADAGGGVIGAFEYRIRKLREFAGARIEWVREDGLVDTLFWGELYRRTAPDEVRYENPQVGSEGRKRLVRERFRLRGSS